MRLAPSRPKLRLWPVVFRRKSRVMQQLSDPGTTPLLRFRILSEFVAFATKRAIQVIRSLPCRRLRSQDLELKLLRLAATCQCAGDSARFLSQSEVLLRVQCSGSGVHSQEQTVPLSKGVRIGGESDQLIISFGRIDSRESFGSHQEEARRARHSCQTVASDCCK